MNEPMTEIGIHSRAGAMHSSVVGNEQGPLLFDTRHDTSKAGKQPVAALSGSETSWDCCQGSSPCVQMT